MTNQNSSYLMAAGLFLTGVGGGFIPWIWRDAVALQLTAPGLAEFVKFLPEIRSGAIQIERLYFLTPLFLAMLMSPLFAENDRLKLPFPLRWLLRMAVIPMALASLSPVWAPDRLLNDEFRLQTVLAGVAVCLAVIAPLLRNIRLNVLIAILIIGGVTSLVLTVWQFSLIGPSIAVAYHEPIQLGIGWWVTVMGIVLSITGGMSVIKKQFRQFQKNKYPTQRRGVAEE
jgi:MFS family permease